MKWYLWNYYKGDQPSLPSRERGLKFGKIISEKETAAVAPFAGAWIEIGNKGSGSGSGSGRSLRGSVD